jgi:hypothetical protein
MNHVDIINNSFFTNDIGNRIFIGISNIINTLKLKTIKISNTNF